MELEPAAEIEEVAIRSHYDHNKNSMKRWQEKHRQHANKIKYDWYAEHREDVLEKRRQKRAELRRIALLAKQQQVVNTQPASSAATNPPTFAAEKIA